MRCKSLHILDQTFGACCSACHWERAMSAPGDCNALPPLPHGEALWLRMPGSLCLWDPHPADGPSLNEPPPGSGVMLFVNMHYLSAGLCSEKEMLGMLPPKPPKAYPEYEAKVQSTCENTVRPTCLNTWDNFTILCHRMPLDSTPKLQVPRRTWTTTSRQLMSKETVCNATARHFHEPLMDVSSSLDGPAEQLWEAGFSPNTNCTHYLEIRGLATAAIGQLQLARLWCACRCMPSNFHLALVEICKACWFVTWQRCPCLVRASLT